MRLLAALRRLRQRLRGTTERGIISSVTSARDYSIVSVVGIVWPVVLYPGEALQIEEHAFEILLVKLSAKGERTPLVGYPKA